jgi:hypothetical protein
MTEIPKSIFFLMELVYFQFGIWPLEFNCYLKFGAWSLFTTDDGRPTTDALPAIATKLRRRDLR